MFSWDKVLEQKGKAVEAKEDELVKAEAGKIEARDIRECLAVGVYDEEEETGYMMHLVTGGRELYEVAEELLEFDVMMGLNGMDYSNSRIILGGIDYSEDIREMNLDDKSDLDMVAAEGGTRRVLERYADRFAESEMCWGADEGHTSLMQLDVDNGDIVYDRSYGRKK